MNDNSKKVIIQNLINTNGLSESFYLALLNAILEQKPKPKQDKSSFKKQVLVVYNNAKVYFDGNHYIAIPYVSQPWKKRKSFNKPNNQVLNDTKETEKNIPTATVALDQLFESLYKENLNKKAQRKKKRNYKRNEVVFSKRRTIERFC